ncbi:MAG: RNA polymerase subunit sigma-70 [Ruthenibacterium sp.]
MTGSEKRQIHTLRLQGKTYRDIAAVLALNESTVKSYCSRNHLTDKDIKKQETDQADCCRQCGKPIKQQAKQKPRRFCSDACRVKWWNDHRFLKQHKNTRVVKCNGCGVAFTVYGKQEKKYCSHECYMRFRFGGGEA